MHKPKAQLIIPLAKLERHLAYRAYFTNRLESLIKLKRLRMKRGKVLEAIGKLRSFSSP